MSGAIREIRRLNPTAKITLCISPSAPNLVEYCPYVDRVFLTPVNMYGDFAYGYETFMPFIKNLLSTRFDDCYTFIRGINTPIFAYISGAKNRIFSFVWGNENAEFFRTLPYHFGAFLGTVVPPYKFGEHVVDANLSVVDYFLDKPVSNRELEVWYTPSEFLTAKNFVSDLSRPLYALVMGARDGKRRYPPERFAALIRMILKEEPTATFINLGGWELDKFFASFLKEMLGEKVFDKHVVNIVGKTNFRIDAAIMSLCDMYIGNNTGNKDIAMAVKCPLLLAECFPQNLDSGILDVPRLYGPYRVPAVSVQPKHALPECAVNKPYHPYGCRAHLPHCITQIAPETLFRGYKILKEKIARNVIDTTYIC